MRRPTLCLCFCYHWHIGCSLGVATLEAISSWRPAAGRVFLSRFLERVSRPSVVDLLNGCEITEVNFEEGDPLFSWGVEFSLGGM